MIIMVEKAENGNLMIEGRIDSTNAMEFEKEVFELCGEEKDVVLDADKLVYISSAGLRVLMKLKKADKDVTVLNVSPEIYDIFDMTGFTEILNVKKKLRFVDTEGLEFIGKGGFGAVYRLTPESILKTFFGQNTDDGLKEGLKSTRAAFVKGVPTAIPFETVMTPDGVGVIYELIISDSLSGYLHQHPEDFDRKAKQYAELAVLLAGTELDSPDVKNVGDKFIGIMEPFRKIFPDEWIDAYNKAVEFVPERHTAVHGDFHGRNIMLQDDELLLIDMDDFGYGHPIWELAGIYNALPGFLSSNPSEEMFMQLIGLSKDEGMRLWNAFAEYYFDGLSEEEKASRLRLAAMYGAIRTTSLAGTRLSPDASEDDPQYQQAMVVLKMMMENLVLPNLEFAETAFETWK
ncbi:phosphotransferase [Eubacteriaceae bacterium ES3]|nr:phosphotransferase [Eubacteriaceae bacterium ES3]